MNTIIQMHDIENSQLQAKKLQPLSKKLVVKNWIVELNLQDHLLIITCQSLEHEYTLRKEFTQVPQHFSIFCENLFELTELLQNSEALSINKTSLIILCQMGKMFKQIGLELNQEDISIETRVINLSKLLGLEKQKVKVAEGQIRNLQEELKKEKELRKAAEESASENRQKQLYKEKELHKAAEESVSEKLQKELKKEKELHKATMRSASENLQTELNKEKERCKTAVRSATENLQKQLQNLQKELKKEKELHKAAVRSSSQNLQKELLKEKERCKVAMSMEQLLRELMAEKELRQEAEESLSNYEDNYVKCAKFGCETLIHCDQQDIIHHGKVICSNDCAW